MLNFYLAVLSTWTIFMPVLNVNAVNPYLICLFLKIVSYRYFWYMLYGIVVSESEAFSSDDSAQYMEHDLGMTVSFL